MMPFIFATWPVEIGAYLLTFFVVVYIYFTWTFDYWKKRGVKFIKPLPIVGNFGSWAFLQKDIGGMFKEIYDRGLGNDYVGLWVFRRPALMVISPELIKAVLVKDFNHFDDRTTHADRNYDPLGSDNLFFGKNPHWKTMRTKLTPLFSSAKMKMMFGLMNDIGDDLETSISKNENNAIEVKDMTSNFTTDVIATTAYGLKGNTLLDPNAPFKLFRKKLLDVNIKRLIQFMSIFFLQGLAKMLKFKVFNEEVSQWMRDVFWDTVNQREKNKDVRNDLIGALISLRDQENGDSAIKFRGDNLVAQVAVFFTAGNETSSTTMTLLLYELAMNPKIQDKLVNEILETLHVTNGEITYEALQEMSYLNMCVSETLRRYPPLPFLDRECTKTYKVPGSSLVIEKGTFVYISLLGLHMDPHYFANPEKFIPERFSKDMADQMVPFTYLPLGEGPRNCIGGRYGLQQIRIGIIHILRKFRVERCAETMVPLEWQTLTLAPTAKGGMHLRFAPRN